MDTPRPPLKLYTCTRCWRRATKCICSSSEAAGDRATRVDTDNWQVLTVFPEDLVCEAIATELKDGDRDAPPAVIAKAVLERMGAGTEEGERRRARTAAERPQRGSRKSTNARRVA